MSDRRPTRREVDDQQQETARFPLGPPDARWTDEELQAYLLTHQAQITALEPAEALLPLEALTDEQLQELAAATTREAAERLTSTLSRRRQKGNVR
jgi:hypothetical protein